MNVLLLSPHFPPNFQRFSTALKEAGANVLGIGDAPYDGLSAPLQAALGEYVHVHNMCHYDGLLRTAGLLTYKHGKIERIDSHNEHWLALGAQLRHDFGAF